MNAEFQLRYRLLAAISKLLEQLPADQAHDNTVLKQHFDELMTKAGSALVKGFADHPEALERLQALGRDVRRFTGFDRRCLIPYLLASKYRLLSVLDAETKSRDDGRELERLQERTKTAFRRLIRAVRRLDETELTSRFHAHKDQTHSTAELQTRFDKARQALQTIHQTLILALQNRPESDLTAQIEQIVALAAAGLADDTRNDKLSLPATAPELYEQRADRRETPLDFLQRVWGAYLEAGLLYQTDLRGRQKTKRHPDPQPGLDRKLFDALWRYCRKHQLALADYLPPVSRKIDRALADLPSPALLASHKTYARLKMAQRRRQRLSAKNG